jgi:hypothetical protein
MHSPILSETKSEPGPRDGQAQVSCIILAPSSETMNRKNAAPAFASTSASTPSGWSKEVKHAFSLPTQQKVEQVMTTVGCQGHCGLDEEVKPDWSNGKQWTKRELEEIYDYDDEDEDDEQCDE